MAYSEISKTYPVYLRAFSKLLAIYLCLLSLPAHGDSLNVAVASNFAATMEVIKQAFEQTTSHKLKLIKSSSGRLYAQIRNGAPFDLFFSADQLRPELLAEEGYTADGVARTYAVGRLVLWSLAAQPIPDENFLGNGNNYTKIAIANPKLAPYGVAAIEVLSNLKLLEATRDKLVMGENVGQAFQFAYSGGAQAGFVAYSQALMSPDAQQHAYWLIPDSLYQPIQQDMVLLQDSVAGREMIQFMGSTTVSYILESSGFYLPTPSSVEGL